MIDQLLADVKDKMAKAIEATARETGKVRTGKASVSLLDGIRVNYYDQLAPLSQVATISVPEPRMIMISPWEKKMVSEISKAILASDLGLNPNSDGNVIRLPIPPLNEERRKELVKMVHKVGEEGHIAIRNIRRSANDDLKSAEKNRDISEDQMHTAMEETQKLHDEHITKIDALIEKKDAEVMEV